MAKQKGILPLVGTIGGINFYYLNGKPVARGAGGGFNGKAIKTKASMQRVRENGSEFGHCSNVNKAFRMGLQPFYTQHSFTFFHSRLMTLFTQLKALDAVNARGERRVSQGVATAQGQQLLKAFKYTPKLALEQVLPFNFVMDWETNTFTLPTFKAERVSFISGATHMGLQFGILDFNFETLEYNMHMAEALVLTKTFLDTSVAFTPVSVPDGMGLKMAILGLRYYQEVDGLLYLLNAENSLGFTVVDCQF